MFDGDEVTTGSKRSSRCLSHVCAASIRVLMGHATPTAHIIGLSDSESDADIFRSNHIPLTTGVMPDKIVNEPKKGICRKRSIMTGILEGCGPQQRG